MGAPAPRGVAASGRVSQSERTTGESVGVGVRGVDWTVDIGQTGPGHGLGTVMTQPTAAM